MSGGVRARGKRERSKLGDGLWFVLVVCTYFGAVSRFGEGVIE